MKLRKVQSVKTGHIYWSISEKFLITNQAVDTQQASLHLSGLPLLRMAMKVLPPHRKRKIMSLTQVKWFEPSVQVESLRRASLASTAAIKTVVVGYSDEAQNPFIPMFKQMITHLSGIYVSLRAVIANQEVIMAKKHEKGS